MVFACSPPCSTASSSKAGLTRHQNGCPTFLTSQELKLEQRRVTAVRTKEKRARVSGPYSKKSGRISSAGLESSKSDTSSNPVDAAHQQSPHVDVDTGSHPFVNPLALPSPAPVPHLPPPPVPSSHPQVLTRVGRAVRKPRRFDDELPAHPVPVPVAPTPPAPPVIRRVILHVRDFFRSALNRFYILREYHHRPSYDPDAHLKPEDLANFQLQEPPRCDDPSAFPPARPPPWPFESMSKYRLMDWFHSGSNQKSEGEVNRLIKEVLTASEFHPPDLTDFTIRQGNKTLDDAYAKNMESGMPFSTDVWQELSVDIEVPVPFKNATPRTFRIPGLQRRSITKVIKDTWESASSCQFHLTPFKRIHVDPSTGKETRIFDEAYTSDAWIEAHDKLQRQPNEPGCNLEKNISGLMFWSDSTHLTNFGTASVWPLYMYFGNLSKYVRARPNSGACHHIAYFPYVSSDRDYARTVPYHCPHLVTRQSQRFSHGVSPFSQPEKTPSHPLQARTFASSMAPVAR